MYIIISASGSISYFLDKGVRYFRQSLPHAQAQETNNYLKASTQSPLYRNRSVKPKQCTILLFLQQFKITPKNSNCEVFNSLNNLALKKTEPWFFFCITRLASFHYRAKKSSKKYTYKKFTDVIPTFHRYELFTRIYIADKCIQPSF